MIPQVGHVGSASSNRVLFSCGQISSAWDAKRQLEVAPGQDDGEWNRHVL